ncbi:MAG: hypothetical protein A3F54_02985 [Candidatus Kerfeldbacteria bacterium RIFCSPHIGHO2_12_FULL_48_17]|uniref:Uncharacterized protein n=1 Tax=Candidatus Kerfeldbacteria bacterium RIFCSPHIGHO2_12_FULL_48_17 TaxID=1798542 RepID=A0A1G2B8A9_9BACT|nr:MAG: hypothetical protein A3F54_02985 [Candidatus Kerfeldbacteria bacterium RIFCSPHIGHO2_12_FULL_48_17]
MKNYKRIFTRNFLGVFGAVLGIGLGAATVVYAATFDGSEALGAGALDNIVFNNDTTFEGVTNVFKNGITIGQQGTGGVTFFNGTIVNSTVNDDGSSIPVTFGDDVRVDGAISRGDGSDDEELPVKFGDDVLVQGAATVEGATTVEGALTVQGAATLEDSLTVQGDLTVADGNTLTLGTGTVSGTAIADVARTINFPLSAFTNTNAANFGPITIASASTEPAFVVNAGGQPMVRWTSADTDTIGSQFQVPSDYVSGGVFKLAFVVNGATGDNDVSFAVATGSNGDALSGATFTAVTGGTNFDVGLTNGDIAVLELTPAALTVDDYVTFRAARTSGTDSVDLLSVVFEYTAAQ